MSSMGSTVATRHWQTLADGRVQCDVCPRHCKLNEGQRGLCFVRARENDQIVLTSYGRSSGFCIDPIEKKPLNHFYPGSPVLSFGTAGCNLACKFCQNWDMSKSRDDDTLMASARPERLAQAAREMDCLSVAYTYNDPTIFMEYAIDTAIACREQGIKSVAVTAGYMCEAPRREFFAHMDAANIDLKGFTEAFYHEICGAHLNDVLDTLVHVQHEQRTWLEITTLLIPGKNDSDQELEQMTRWIARELGPEVPLHFSAFHPDWKMRDVPATPPETLQRARRIAMDQGLHFVYTGNVHDRHGGSTWCPGCGERLIERDWYRLGGWAIDAQGACGHCGTAIAGHFAAGPGQWGPQRLPVRLVS